MFDGYCSLCRVGLREVSQRRIDSGHPRSTMNRATLATNPLGNVQTSIRAKLHCKISFRQKLQEYIEKKPVDNIDRDASRQRNLVLGHVSTVFYLNYRTTNSQSSLYGNKSLTISSIFFSASALVITLLFSTHYFIYTGTCRIGASAWHLRRSRISSSANYETRSCYPLRVGRLANEVQNVMKSG